MTGLAGPPASVAKDPKRHFDTAGSLQTFRSDAFRGLVSACTSVAVTAQSDKRRKHSSMSITEARGPAARLALVEEHVRLENRLDLDGIMGTFGASARYDEEPWDDHHIGREAVRAYYDGLLRAAARPYASSGPAPGAGDAVLLEVIISGHHLGAWRGLPPTGRPVQFPLCGVFTFDSENRLAGEKIYYDRATVTASARRFPRA